MAVLFGEGLVLGSFKLGANGSESRSGCASVVPLRHRPAGATGLRGRPGDDCHAASVVGFCGRVWFWVVIVVWSGRGSRFASADHHDGPKWSNAPGRRGGAALAGR